MHVGSQGTSPLRVEGTSRFECGKMNVQADGELRTGNQYIRISEADGLARAFKVPPALDPP